MHIFSTSRLQRRRGISSILGLLIFIGVLFTSVFPMYIVMQQSDTMLEKKKLEVTRTDDEKGRERAELYATPTNPDDPERITVTVLNKCEMPIEFTRIWINSEYTDVSYTIYPMGSLTLPTFTVNAEEGDSFDVVGSTARGNVYASQTGLLYYGEDGWDTEEFGFTVVVPFRESWMESRGKWGQSFYVSIWRKNTTAVPATYTLIYESVEIIRAISASEQYFPLKEPGQYKIWASVEAAKKSNSPTHQAHTHPFYRHEGEETLIDWPIGLSKKEVVLEVDNTDYCTVCNVLPP